MEGQMMISHIDTAFIAGGEGTTYQAGNEEILGYLAAHNLKNVEPIFRPVVHNRRKWRDRRS